MYSRITGSSSQYTAGQADEAGQATDSQRFAESLADAEASSSSAAPRPYSLVSEPPIEEINRSQFSKHLRSFYGDDIKHIADNPQEYSDFVSDRARRTVYVARLGATVDHKDNTRYFSYNLGDKSVGLLRSQGGLRIKDELVDWREHFPGRKHFTSIDLRVAHPLVENAGDILLEHQLRLDGQRPLVRSRPATEEAEPRLEQMGFVDVGGNHFVLDPRQHPDRWTKNENEAWQRADKPARYLSKTETNDSDNEASTEEYSSEYSSGEDPSWYFDQLNMGPGSTG